jgi:hypothetical protein
MVSVSSKDFNMCVSCYMVSNSCSNCSIGALYFMVSVSSKNFNMCVSCYMVSNSCSNCSIGAFCFSITIFNFV